MPPMSMWRRRPPLLSWLAGALVFVAVLGSTAATAEHPLDATSARDSGGDEERQRIDETRDLTLSINAITLMTHDMEASAAFYEAVSIGWGAGGGGVVEGKVEVESLIAS